MEKFLKNILVVICGPTAVGKTRTAIQVAKKLSSEIISADSRQFYKELKIGVAAPSPDELRSVTHHFVGHLSVQDYYNISTFEQDVIRWLEEWFKKNRYAVMVGGSGLYIDAVCRGIDDLPDPDVNLRQKLKEELKHEGIESLKLKLKLLDPEYFSSVDLNNPNRILRALEVCIITGKPYSAFRKNKAKARNFDIMKIGLNLPRVELIRRIDERVEGMIAGGLVDEVKGLLPYQNLNALNTVGYKEIFKFIEGGCSLETAIEKIKVNTRKYAKRQVTWFKKDPDIKWFHPDDEENIISAITTG